MLATQPVLYDGASGDGIDGAKSGNEADLLSAEEKIKELMSVIDSTQSETDKLNKVRKPPRGTATPLHTAT